MKTTIRQHLRVLGHTWEVSAPVGTTLDEVLPNIPDLPSQNWHVEGQLCRPSAVVGENPLIDGAELSPAIKGKPSSSLRLTVTSGPQQGQTWLLTPGKHEIGRDHPLVSGDPLVSRLHAVLSLRHGEVTVTDVGSANGTKLRGEALTPHTDAIWHLGDHLSIGGSEILLTLDVREIHLPKPINGRCPRPAHMPLTSPPALKLEWPAPPPPAGHHPLRLVASLLPLPLGFAAAYLFHSTMLLLMMAASPLIMLFTALDDHRQGKRQTRAERAQREAKLRQNAQAMHAQLSEEKHYRQSRFLSVDGLLQAAAGRSSGLDTASANWPLELRLGVGSCHSPSVVQLEEGIPFHPQLEDVPVVCAVTPGNIVQLSCATGIRPRVLTQIVTALIVHGAPGARPPSVASETLTYAGDDRTDLIVRATVQEVLAAFPEEQVGSQTAGVLVIEQDESITTQKLEELTKSGFAIVWVGDRCPAVVQQHFALKGGYRASSGPHDAVFTADLPGLEWLDDIAAAARRWQPRAYPLGIKSALPHRLTPADLGMNDQVSWGHCAKMDVPIGVDSQGSYTLNLEKFGPHALVAGTTGSGKSEFLLAYLRGLFTLNSPEHVTAILIDYKGGATFGPLAQAPHVVGVICDLDVGLADRALIGLRAEIHRREKLLREHAVSSFAAYQALGLPKESLPRLLVVVDEFRVLAEELPEFVSGLIRIAAVGRSLGIHLILATQRPGGVVTADMRANIDLRVCLRVREKADSIDVLESPVAAHIDRLTPGRAYIAVAGEKPHEVQTMYTSCGVGAEKSAIHIHPVSTPGRPQSPPTSTCPGCAPLQLSAKSDLQQAVEACVRAAQDLPAPHRPVLPALSDRVDANATKAALRWSELSEAHCALDQLDQKCGEEAIALVDMPELQAQPALFPDTSSHVSICGAARTGRSNAARAIASRLDPTGAHTWWVSPDDEKAAKVIRPDDLHAVAALMDALTGGETPQLLIVDGWESLYETLLLLNRGMAADDFISLIARAHRLPMQIVVTGGRALMTSKLSALFEMRFIMRQNDVGEYSLAGLRPQHIPAAMPPGRALALPYGRQVHFVECPGKLTSSGRPQAQTAAPEAPL